VPVPVKASIFFSVTFCRVSKRPLVVAELSVVVTPLFSTAVDLPLVIFWPP